MSQTNIGLYQKSRKVDKEDYETPYESFATDFYQRLITEKLKDQDARILDVGCFKGILVNKLRSYKSFGLDVTADGFFKPGKYMVGTAEHLPVKSDSLDCVAITEVIEHIMEPAKVFQEIHRVLKPKGYLLITHPNKYNLFDELIEHIKENNTVRRLLNRPLYEGVQHVQEFTYSDTIDFLKPLNFTIESCHALTFSLHRIFSMFVYGRLKCTPVFKLIEKVIQLEYFLMRRLGKAGLPLAGSCIMLFKASKTV
ncbi:MAG: class I SAM-dependent methyltransferase [Nitrospinales bacterium]